MNCQPGDIAIIKTTHPLEYLHGALVECLRLEGAIASLSGWVEGDVWYFKFLGSEKLDDNGELNGFGYIPDRYLRPVKGEPETERHDEEITA